MLLPGPGFGGRVFKKKKKQQQQQLEHVGEKLEHGYSEKGNCPYKNTFTPVTPKF